MTNFKKEILRKFRVSPVVAYTAMYLLICSITSSCKKDAINYHGIEGGVLCDVRDLHSFLVGHVMDQQAEGVMVPKPQIVSNIIAQFGDELRHDRNIKILNGGNVVDRWGRPIRVEVVELRHAPEKPKIRVWSVGKNGIDENGAGDDLLAE